MTFKPQVIPTAMRTMAPNNTTEKLADLVCGDLAYGLATRALNGWRPFFLAGRRSAIGAGLECHMWRGPTDLVPYVAASGNITIVSSSAQDAYGAFTGVGGVLVEYIDASGYLRVATMAGTTPVSVYKAQLNDDGTVSALAGFPVATGLRVLRAYATLLGTSAPATWYAGNIGNIDIKIGASVVCRIGLDPEAVAGMEGDGTSYGSLFTVPRGFYALLLGLGISCDAATNVRASISVKKLAIPRQRLVQLPIDRSVVSVSLGSPLRISPRYDVDLSMLRVGGGFAGGCNLHFALVPDPADPDPTPQYQPPSLG